MQVENCIAARWTVITIALLSRICGECTFCKLRPGVMVLFVRRRACGPGAASALPARIRASLRNYREKETKRRKRGTRAGGRTGVPRPPKVKSRDGGGPSGDRALQDAKSKREVKRVCSPLDAIGESLVSLRST